MRIAAAVVVLLVAGGGTVQAYDEEALSKARAAADTLNVTLRARMARTVMDSGPVAAIYVCAYQAKTLADAAAARYGVSARRTALRLRNRANAPDDYDQALLARFVADFREGTLPDELMDEVRENGRTVYRYAKPLVADRLCITCHGRAEQIPAEVRKVLETRYPDDAATGYGEGDFVGIVSVVVPVR